MSDATQDWQDTCEVCGKETPFRETLGGQWFCTVCGTRYFPTKEGQSPKKATSIGRRPDVTPGRSRRRHSPWMWVLAVVFILPTTYFEGLKFASGSMSASCGPSPIQCQVTIYSHSIWPERIDTGSIVADGIPVEATGGGIAWPFGRTSVLLFSQDGTALTTMNSLSFSSGPLLAPSTSDSVTLQPVNSAAGASPTPVPPG
jgi:hypothetical protein